ncbi:MAG: D-alanine--D-alanine ligase [Anaerolineae bacterium]|nr:MAG: D-alanine--D-alanine ligase [Anaerolineae bacterium]
MMDKLTIGVLFGGRSGEHAVSLMSARFVLSVLDRARYDVIEIGITRRGEWLTGENVLAVMESGAYDRLQPVTLLPDPTRAGLYRLDADGLKPLAQLDVLFPVLHGTFGEDGTLQGLLEMAEMAYVGPGVAGAAVGMDKAIFADLMRAQGIPVVPGVLALRSEMGSSMDTVLDRVEAGLADYPYFVKPANLGSSVGVSKVKSRSDLVEGLLEAAEYDRRVLVQKGLDVREIEVSVMGNDQPIASVCGEVLPGEEFYSYNAKYHDERSRTVIPAKIPETTAERIRALAVKAYAACDMAGLARADFFLDRKTGEVYINEINTIPGFTSISMYPMLWAASGVSNADLVDKLIAYALERKAQRDATRREFEREASA